MSKTFSCPGCYGDNLQDLNTVQPANIVIYTLLREIVERENGSAGVSQYSSVGTVFKTPASVPLTSLEEMLLTCLVK